MVSNLWLLLSGKEALYLIAKDDSCLLLKNADHGLDIQFKTLWF